MGAKSIYTGVRYDGKTTKFTAEIQHNGNRYFCGRADNALAAAKLRDMTIIRLNLPKEKLQVLKPLVLEKRKQSPHPELRKGETFLMNILEKEVESFPETKPEWVLSYRIGETAYKTGNEEFSQGYKPVFVTIKKENHG
jgi:hypothetical protein